MYTRKFATATPHILTKGHRGAPLSLTGAFMDIARISRDGRITPEAPSYGGLSGPMAYLLSLFTAWNDFGTRADVITGRLSGIPSRYLGFNLEGQVTGQMPCLRLLPRNPSCLL